MLGWLPLLIVVGCWFLAARNGRRYRNTGNGKAARSYEVEPPDMLDKGWILVSNAFFCLVIGGFILSLLNSCGGGPG